MAEIHLAQDYAINPSLIWDRIADFHALHTWLPAIKDTERDSTRPTVRRVIRHDGLVVLEEDLGTSAENRTVHYTIIGGDVPVRDFDGHIAVLDGPDGGSTVKWDVSFATDGPEDEIVAAIAQLLTEGLENLEKTSAQ